MKIVVVGAGEVGYHICQTLSERGHHVTAIDNSPSVANEVEENLNVRLVRGNGASASVLQQAEVSECDYFMALTSDDTTNLLSCSLSKAMGARTIIARIHDQTYADTSIVNYQLHFGIDYLINPEALSAAELAKYIRNPGRIAVENFARGKVEVQMATVSKKSNHVDQSLKDISLDKRVRIGFVQRGDSFEVATAETVIREKDKITLIGPPDILFDVRQEFEPQSSHHNIGITLFGGSETAIAIVRLLTNPRFKIRLIESDLELCRDLAERFPQITVIQGTATSLRLMEEEHVGDSDYFVACTKKDEDNIMTCLQAAKLGADHVQLIINKPDYEDVLDHMRLMLGVDAAVSPRVVTVKEVLRLTSEEPYMELASLPGDTVKIIELRIAHDSHIAGKLIKDIAWPPNSLVVAVLHKFEAAVPGPDDTLLSGDRVVAIVSKHQINDLVKLLT